MSSFGSGGGSISGGAGGQGLKPISGLDIGALTRALNQGAGAASSGGAAIQPGGMAISPQQRFAALMSSQYGMPTR